MANLFRSNSRGSISRNISTILTGGVLLFIPGLTMKTVIIVIGGMLILSGIITLIISNVRKRGVPKGIWSAQGDHEHGVWDDFYRSAIGDD